MNMILKNRNLWYIYLETSFSFIQNPQLITSVDKPTVGPKEIRCQIQLNLIGDLPYFV